MVMKYKNVTLGKVEAVFNKLGGIEGVERFLRGELELVDRLVAKHIIDCDADPFVPKDWKVVEHQPGGKLEWDPCNVELYVCDEQQESLLLGYLVQRKLKGMPVMNACVLDYLIEHSEIIPQEWKSKHIFFWGTIYCDKDDHERVRCLVWDGFKWRYSHRRINQTSNDWYNRDPAILALSSSVRE